MRCVAATPARVLAASPGDRFYAICFAMIAKLILVAIGATQGATATLVDVASARRAIGTPSAAATAARIEQHASRGSTDALVGELRAVLADPTLEAAAQEWLLESGLHGLRRLPATPAARALVAELSTRAPRIFTRVEPEHGSHAVPLYDVGAVARYTERDWVRGEARVAATKALALGTADALEAWLEQDGSPRAMAVRNGILDAWRATKAERLEGQRAAVVAAMHAGRDADRLALELARRLRDPELYSLTIGHAEPAVALTAVQAAERELDSVTALGVLGKAADREPIASAALLAIGRLAAADSAAQQVLLDRLSDPVSGDSAAAALARIDDPGVTASLGTRLKDAKDETTRRRVALALRLNGSPAARDTLGRLVESKQGSPQLRKEVAAWLARGR